MAADEFDIIARHFAPLAQHGGARGLVDDVALLDGYPRLVVTSDAIVEGVHFLADDPIETIAKKALRVNLSDLAAKGARPIGVTLSLIWPSRRSADQIADFARGLGEDLALYDVALLGGDTTSTPGPLTISITAFGAPLGPRTPSRADAMAGEQVWVTGRIGDSYLGLMQLTAQPGVLGAAAADQIDSHAEMVRTRYRVPEPPVAFADCIARFAGASTDVSDGLIADAKNIARASNVSIRIDSESIPLGPAGHAFVEARGAEGLRRLITAGDDYQALFTAAPHARGAIVAAARAAGIEVALIGDVEAGAGVRVISAGGAVLDAPISGHRHAIGS